VTQFQQPTNIEMMIAEELVNRPAVIGAYASHEWDDLNEDAQVWVAALVREARQDHRQDLSIREAAASIARFFLGNDDDTPQALATGQTERHFLLDVLTRLSVDDACVWADKISEQHRLRANKAEAAIRAALGTLATSGESWQAYSLRLRSILWASLDLRDSDTRRMAETGTGSVRSTGSAGRNGIAPTPAPTPSEGQSS